MTEIQHAKPKSPEKPNIPNICQKVNNKSLVQHGLTKHIFWLNPIKF